MDKACDTRASTYAQAENSPSQLRRDRIAIQNLKLSILFTHNFHVAIKGRRNIKSAAEDKHKRFRCEKSIQLSGVTHLIWLTNPPDPALYNERYLTMCLHWASNDSVPLLIQDSWQQFWIPTWFFTLSVISWKRNGQLIKRAQIVSLRHSCSSTYQ